MPPAASSPACRATARPISISATGRTRWRIRRPRSAAKPRPPSTASWIPCATGSPSWSRQQGGKNQTAAAVTAVLQFAPGSAAHPGPGAGEASGHHAISGGPSPCRGRHHRLVGYRRQQPGRQRPVARPRQCGLCGPHQPRPAGGDQRRHPRRRTPGRRRRGPAGRDPGAPGRLGSLGICFCRESAGGLSGRGVARLQACPGLPFRPCLVR